MFSRPLPHFFSLHGRIRRCAWWGSIAVAWLAFIVLFLLLETVTGRTSTLLLYPFFLWAMLALCVKRYHDVGKSGVWLVLVAIPVLGVLWVVVELGLRKGGAGENDFGDEPAVSEIDYLTVS